MVLGIGVRSITDRSPTRQGGTDGDNAARADPARGSRNPPIRGAGEEDPAARTAAVVRAVGAPELGLPRDRLQPRHRAVEGPERRGPRLGGMVAGLVLR